MTQEKANQIFDTFLGQQLLSFFCTSDNQVFIRYEEALNYINRKKEEDENFTNEEVTEWYPE